MQNQANNIATATNRDIWKWIYKFLSNKMPWNGEKHNFCETAWCLAVLKDNVSCETPNSL